MAEKKHVTGINAEFAETTAPSGLNQGSTQVAWDVQALNRQRREGWQQHPAPRSAASGIIPSANPLGDHAGQLSEEVGY